MLLSDSAHDSGLDLDWDFGRRGRIGVAYSFDFRFSLVNNNYILTCSRSSTFEKVDLMMRSGDLERNESEEIWRRSSWAAKFRVKVRFKIILLTFI